MSSPLSLTRFFLTRQLIYKNTKFQSKQNISLGIFVSDTSIARDLHLSGERTLQLHKDPYSFLCTLDQISVFVSLKNKEHVRLRTLLSYRYIISSALINDWENNIAYGKNPSKASPWLLASAIRFMLYVNNVLASNGCRGTVTAGTFFNLYPDLCLKIVFPALKLTQNCYLHYNINIFS